MCGYFSFCLFNLHLSLLVFWFRSLQTAVPPQTTPLVLSLVGCMYHGHCQASTAHTCAETQNTKIMKLIIHCPCLFLIEEEKITHCNTLVLHCVYQSPMQDLFRVGRGEQGMLSPPTPLEICHNAFAPSWAKSWNKTCLFMEMYTHCKWTSTCPHLVQQISLPFLPQWP